MQKEPLRHFVLSTDWDDAPGLDRAESVKRAFAKVREPVRAIVASAGGEVACDGMRFGSSTHPFAGKKELLVSVPRRQADRAEKAFRDVPGILGVDVVRSFAV